MVGCSAPPPIPHVAGDYDGCADCSQLAKDLAWSLDHHPDEWSADGFSVTRGSVSIWIANGPRFISAGKDYLGEGWQPDLDDQDLIWRASQRWQLDNLERSISGSKS